MLIHVNMMLPLLLHAPKKQKWIFMLRTCATWQSLTTTTTAQSKLLQALAEAATRCTPLLLQLLRRNAEDVVVVVVIVVVCWMQHLSAVFVVWIVSKTCAAAHPPLWQGVRCLLPPSSLSVVPCIFCACLMSCLKIYCHKLMQVASCKLRQWQEQENDGGKWKCE